MSAGGLPEVGAFRFRARRYDPETGVLALAYAFDDGEDLVEELEFPHAPWPPDPSRQAALDRAFELLHWIAGVSYWKACVPPAMRMDGGEPGPDTARLLTDVYVHGLAEFGWVNGIDVAARVRFPAGGAGRDPLALDLPERALVAMGGGKDSLVSLETLRAAGVELLPVCVGGAPLIGETVRRAGLPLLRIGRRLAPRLGEMNRAGALNGHVPVTAIHSAILACAAILYGFRWVVFSNERSASEATRVDEGGREVNHQYSKGEAFERAFQAELDAHVSPGVQCFSLLRPLAELGVAARFARLARYHDVFSSCNRNFHQDGARIEGRWCGDCPKCRFAALALAPFVEPAALRAIQGADLLDDPAQLDGFRALCGIGAEKPFECVGEIEECRSALADLAGRPAWRGKAVIATLAPEVRATGPRPLASWLAPDGPHAIPSSLWDRCRAHL